MAKPPPVAPHSDLSALRRQITDQAAQNAVAMVQHAIDAVNEEGQYQAIKYLFEMVGLYPHKPTTNLRSRIRWLKRFCINWVCRRRCRKRRRRNQGDRKENSQRPIP
jgi:hypothetical protein